MAKKSRQKRRQQQQQHKLSKGGKASLQSSSSAGNAHPDQQRPAILQRLRDGNPSTRQVALAALLHTTLSPEALSDKNNNNNNNRDSDSGSLVSTALLQTIREQVMDVHLSCATTAAACLSNFVAFASQKSKSNVLTAGWMVVFVKRLQDCCIQFSKHGDNNNNNNNAVSTDTDLQSMDTSAKQPTKKKKDKKTDQSTASSSSVLASWLELVEHCLDALVSLLEDNPIAVDKLCRSDSLESANLRTDFMTAILSLIQYSTTYLQRQSQSTATLTTATTTTGNGSLSSSTNSTTVVDAKWKSVQVQACRLLHSAWDDNPTLVQSWFLLVPKPTLASNTTTTATSRAQDTLSVLRSVFVPSARTSTTDTELQPCLAQLHVVGAWMAAYLVLGATEVGFEKQISSSTGILSLLEQDLSTAIQILKTCIATFGSNNSTLKATASTSSSSSSSSTLERLAQDATKAFDAYKIQQADDVLERQVIAAVERRREPARLIARRLKAQQEKQKAASALERQQAKEAIILEEMNENDQDQMDDIDDRMQEEALAIKDKDEPARRGKLRAKDQIDKEEAWYDIQQQWQNTVGPLQLSLEMLANLTSSSTGSSTTAEMNENHDDDVEMMQNNDDEDYTMTMDREEEASPAWIRIQELIQQQELPRHAFDVLLGPLVSSPLWCKPIQSKTTVDTDISKQATTTSNSQQTELPVEIRDSVSDLQSKAAVCVSHSLSLAFQQQQQQYSLHKSLVQKDLWSELRRVTSQAIDVSAQEACLSAMVVYLQFIINSGSNISQQSSTQDIDTDIAFLCQILQSASSTPTLCRDATCLLGLFWTLCSSSSSATTATITKVTEDVCRTLLSIPSVDHNGNNSTSSPMVVSEVLNVLMDVFSNDDKASNDIFNQYKVLDHFVTSVPHLKTLIRKHQIKPDDKENNNSAHETAMLQEQWKEIALNGSRFIQYKKGLLS